MPLLCRGKIQVSVCTGFHFNCSIQYSFQENRPLVLTSIPFISLLNPAFWSSTHYLHTFDAYSGFDGELVTETDSGLRTVFSECHILQDIFFLLFIFFFLPPSEVVHRGLTEGLEFADIYIYSQMNILYKSNKHSFRFTLAWVRLERSISIYQC